MTEFRKHPGITMKNDVLCCYRCECPFVGADGKAPDRMSADLDLRPIDDRSCVPTFRFRFRETFLPLITLWQIFTIVATQGLSIGYNRLCWRLFGPDWNSGCSRCGGTGRVRVFFDPEVGGPADVNCSSCNGLHD